MEEEEPVNDEIQDKLFKKPCHRRIPTASGTPSERAFNTDESKAGRPARLGPKVPMIIETLERHQFDLWRTYQKNLELEPTTQAGMQSLATQVQAFESNRTFTTL